MRSCLSPSEVQGFLEGRLTGRTKQAVRDHLRVCSRCRHALEATEVPIVGSGLSSQASAGTTQATPIRAPEPAGPPPRGRFPLPFSIEGYDILREIHRGAQGIVFEAVQTATHRRVALKVLLQGKEASAVQLHRFQREVYAIASLHHPNIVTLYDSGVTEDHCYFAMEFVEGERLDRDLAHRPRSLKEKVHLFWKISNAVGHAHRHGIVHRDLKPANVLVDSEGEPRILDFGLAKLYADAAGESPATFTRTGEFMGTLAYASPEQTRGDSMQVDARSDVYSLGVILYESLTGKPPYAFSGSLESDLRMIGEAEPAPPSRLLREIDRDLDTILLKALVKEPERRYASAAELAEDLSKYLEGSPISARPDTFTYLLHTRLRRAVSRNVWAADLMVGTMAVVANVALLSGPVELRYLDRHFEAFSQATAEGLAGAGWSDTVVVAALDDDTYEAIPDLARREGHEGVSLNDPFSWRRLHGAFMKRLAGARPSVVAWDIFFRQEKPDHDPAMVEGIDALRAAGTRVILAVDGVDRDHRPLLSPPILSHADGWGWLFLGESHLTRRVEPALAVHDPPAEVAPSLALAAFAAHRGPGLRPEFRWNPRLSYIELHHRRISPAGAGVDASLPPPMWIPVLDPEERWGAGAAPGANLSERMLGCTKTLIPAREVLERHTIPYRAVFEEDPSELRRRLEGKILFVGNTRVRNEGVRDRHLVDDASGGRQEFGVYVHAMAVCDLLQVPSLRRPGFLHLTILAILSALAGLAVGKRLPAERWLLWAIVASICVCAAILALAAAGTAVFHLLLNPTSLVVTAWLAMAGGAWVSRVAEAQRPLRSVQPTSTSAPALLA